MLLESLLCILRWMSAAGALAAILPGIVPAAHSAEHRDHVIVSGLSGIPHLHAVADEAACETALPGKSCCGLACLVTLIPSGLEFVPKLHQSSRGLDGSSSKYGTEPEGFRRPPKDAA